MNFLLDENLSERLGLLLSNAGHYVNHVRALGLRSADDPTVMAKADQLDAVLISADTDFGALLAASGAAGPSVVLLRHEQGRSVEEVAALILDNFPVIEDAWTTGAIVVIDDERIRIRQLPI